MVYDSWIVQHDTHHYNTEQMFRPGRLYTSETDLQERASACYRWIKMHRNINVKTTDKKTQDLVTCRTSPLLKGKQTRCKLEHIWIVHTFKISETEKLVLHWTSKVSSSTIYLQAKCFLRSPRQKTPVFCGGRVDSRSPSIRSYQTHMRTCENYK